MKSPLHDEIIEVQNKILKDIGTWDPVAFKKHPLFNKHTNLLLQDLRAFQEANGTMTKQKRFPRLDKRFPRLQKGSDGQTRFPRGVD
jgi:hypothetical protein